MKGKSQPKSFHHSSWEDAIGDAKERLAKTKQQAARLRNAIRIFEANAKSGEPWPGESARQR
jgi:hypothetical protein